MIAATSFGRDELVEQDLVEPAQVVDLAERRVEDAGQQRPEAGVVLRLRGGQRDRAVRPAVERAEERDDVRPAGRVAGELDRGLDDLRRRSCRGTPGRGPSIGAMRASSRQTSA